MALFLVSVGTDGVKDWVQTPNGLKHSLGTVSVLSFVTKLAKNSRVARHVLNQFLKKGEALLSVDENKMWSLLAPVRARWAADAFMSSDQRHHTSTRPSMETIFDHLNRTKAVVAWLNKRVAAGVVEPKAFEYLKREASKLRGPDKVKLSYYTLEGAQEVSSKVALGVDALESNTRLVLDIQKKAEQTAATINRLEKAGKKFNASRARADVRAVTTRVATLVEKTQLVESWVTSDLQKLARRNNDLHTLFHPKG